MIFVTAPYCVSVNSQREARNCIFCLAGGSGQGLEGQTTQQQRHNTYTNVESKTVGSTEQQKNIPGIPVIKMSSNNTPPNPSLFFVNFDNLRFMRVFNFFLLTTVHPHSSALARELPHFLFLLPSQEESRAVAADHPAVRPCLRLFLAR